VLTRDEIRFNAVFDQEGSKLAYEVLWWDPLKADLECFIQNTQMRVAGEVSLKLFKGQTTVIGRSSPWALYSEELASFDTTTFDQRESTGSVKNFGRQSRMYNQLLEKFQKEQ
ncbi:MAG: argininosuccinate synthase, partial [Pseudobdellovibrionaceae bacterium]